MRSLYVTVLVLFGAVGLFGLFFRHLRVRNPKDVRRVVGEIPPARLLHVGTIWEGLPTRVSVELENPFSHPLTIAGIVTSCSCAHVTPQGPLVLPSRAKKELRLTFTVEEGASSIDNVTGRRTVRARIIARRSKDAVFSVWLLEGTVRRPFLQSPRLPLEVGLGDFPVVRDWEFRMDGDLELFSVDSTSGDLVVRWQEVDKAESNDRTYRLSAVLDAGSTEMEELHEIRIFVRDRRSGEALPPIVLHARWQPLVAIPGQIDLGVVPVGQWREHRFVLQARQGVIDNVVVRAASGTTTAQTAVQSNGEIAAVVVRQRIAEEGSCSTAIELAVEMRDGQGKRFRLQKRIPMIYYGSCVAESEQPALETSSLTQE